MKISKALLIALKALLGFMFVICIISPSASASTALAYDTPTAGTIASVAQSNSYTLQANANDVLSFTVVTTSGSVGPCLLLYDPSATLIAAAGGNSSQVVEMNNIAVTLTGAYTLLVKDCADSNTGNYILFAQKDNAPIGSASLPLDVVTSGTIASDAQSNAYTLSANAGDVFDFTVVTTQSTSGGLGPCLLLYDTTGKLLAAAGGNSSQVIEMNLIQVSKAGTYNLFVKDCADKDTGAYDLFAQRTNNPANAVPIVYGETMAGAINSIAQSNAYTLIGTQNDLLNFTVVAASSSTLGPCIAIYNTTGTPTLDAVGGNGTKTVEMNNYKIPATGTYNVIIKDCADKGIGNYTLQTECVTGACLLPVPVVLSISPTSALAGGSGFTLTVNGQGFAHVNAQSAVQWNGADLTTTFVSTGQLTAQIPATDIASAQNVCVTVFTPAPGGGTSANKCPNFAVDNPKPTLTSILPTSATAGGAAFPLTVSGTGFNSQSIVYWNTTALAVTSVSSTQITATVIASDIATAGTANITVTDPAPGGGTTTAATFTIDNPSPALTKISPTSITAGNSSATTLTLTGTGFVSTSAVDWTQTVPTSQPTVGLATTYVSSTQLTATIPALNTACGVTANITVVNPSPVNPPATSGALPFTANNPVPTLTSISPTNIAAGSGSFTLTVNGSKFLKSCSVIQWNGTSLTTTFVSATQLTATVPASDVAANGTANVTVNNPAPGGGTTGSQPFTVGPFPVPVLTSISPTSATAGGAAFTLTVNGSSFVQNSIVDWNGVAVTTTYVNSTKLTAAVPASDIATAGTDTVTVVNPTPGGGASNPGQTFTVNNPLPTATSLSPGSIPAASAKFTLTVNGSNFVSTSVVQWNGSSLTTTFVSAAQLTASVPAAAVATPGTASVTVKNPTPGGGTSSPALTFTILNPLAATPVISPAAGSYGYEIQVSISDSTPGATIYYTTDGTTPSSTSSTSKKYASPFLLAGSATVQAIAVAANFTNSALASTAYVIAGSPSVLGMPAISVTSSAGTLRVLVNGHNLAGQVLFVYGTSSSALTSTTPAQTVSASLNAVIFQASLTGLNASTTYYYQAVATTPGGTSTGAILSFTTP